VNRCVGKFWASDNTIVVEPIRSSLDGRFAYYLLLTAKLNRHAGGAAQPLLTQSRLKPLEFELPTLIDQRRIAEILGAYDDLIENNMRRIAILEEMARRLYDEWFVRFHFPGHEQVCMLDSLLGPIPEGWEVGRLADVAQVNALSLSPRRPPEVISYIDISSVSLGRVEPAQKMAFADAPSRARRIVSRGDVIWSCVRPNRRSHALLIRPEPDTVVSTGFAVLTPKTVPSSFLYAATTTDAFVEYLTNHATGAAYPAVGQRDFERARLIIPSEALLWDFDKLAEPVAELVDTLERQNRNLRIQRDLLLPKLISGQVDVSEAPGAEEIAAA
jgi:type I restriction enzyme S subunit